MNNEIEELTRVYLFSISIPLVCLFLRLIDLIEMYGEQNSIVMFFVKGTYRWFYKFFNRIVFCIVGVNMDIVLKNIFVTDFFVRNIRMISKERV